MKKTWLIWLGTAAVVIAGIILCYTTFFTGSGDIAYYTQIDNSRVETNDSKGGVIDFKGNLPYSYTLTSYDENGEEKEITFGTSKELQEGAFISLEVVPVRGVTSWAEVQYEELPAAVQSYYTVPANE